MLRNRIAQDGGRNRSIKVGNQGNDMSYSFSASYGITREQWNKMTTREQDEFVWAQRSEDRERERVETAIALERERVEAAIQSYKSSLAGIKAKTLSRIEDTDGSVSAYFDRLINARIEAFSQEALGNMPSGMQAVRFRLCSGRLAPCCPQRFRKRIESSSFSSRKLNSRLSRLPSAFAPSMSRKLRIMLLVLAAAWT